MSTAPLSVVRRGGAPRRLAPAFLLAILLSAPGRPAGEMWPGVFEPREQAVIPSEAAMPVARIAKQPGEACRAGDVLVEFDSTLREAAVAAAAARLKSARLQLDGTRNLFERGQSTAMEAAKAESEVAQMEMELAVAKRDLAACRVVAPFSGKIVDSRVRAHEWAERGAALLLLVDDALLRVRFFLPEAMFPGIAVGDRVRVRAPAAARETWGEVSRLGVVFDPVSRTFDVWADVDNRDDALRPGMTAEVEWPVAEESRR